MTVMIETPGGTVEYKIPIIKMNEYSLEDIFNKEVTIQNP